MNIQAIADIFGAINIQVTGSRYFGNPGSKSDLDIVVYFPREELSEFPTIDFESDREVAFDAIIDRVSGHYDRIPTTDKSYIEFHLDGEFEFYLSDDFAYTEEKDRFVFTINDGDIPIHLIICTDSRDFAVWQLLSNAFKYNVSNDTLNSVDYRRYFSILRVMLCTSDIGVRTDLEDFTGLCEELISMSLDSRLLALNYS